MKTEIWMPVLGYEGLYEVSSEERVRSLDRWIVNGGKKQFRKGKQMSLNNCRGYIIIGLHKDGGMKQHQLHRLVYEAFIGTIPNGMQVNHIDENKANNRVSNLNLLTPKENSNWGTRTKRIAEVLKAKCPYSLEERRERDKQRWKEYYLKNKEKIKARTKKRYENNRDEILKKEREYHQKNIERINIQRQKFREENRERLREENREFYRRKKKKEAALNATS